MRYTSLALALMLGTSWTAYGVTLSTQDATQVTTFQSGSTVLGFDNLPGNNESSGAPVASVNAVTNQYQSLGVLFSSTGGPAVAISVQGQVNQSDAKSPFNLLSGTSAGTGTVPRVDFVQPITLDFVAPGTTALGITDRVGAWNDPTGSRITLSVFDVNNNLLESVQGDQGFFVGINHPGIARAVFTTTLIQSVAGFSLDDVTFGPVAAAGTVPSTPPVGAVPEPASVALLALSVAGLSVRLHRRRAAR